MEEEGRKEGLGGAEERAIRRLHARLKKKTVSGIEATRCQSRRVQLRVERTRMLRILLLSL